MRTNQAKERRRTPALGRARAGVKVHETKVRPVRSADMPRPVLVAAEEPFVPPADIHFGVLLRRARERRGMSQQDVVRLTRIAERWIPALEEARLDVLPAPVFVGGYVRCYARAVGLDENELMTRYQALTQQRAAVQVEPETEPQSEPLSARPALSFSFRLDWRWLVLAAVASALVVLCAGLALRRLHG